jgi:PHD/YefM family antitoxin component YafN of YafNO toxin-antitoxin module
MSATALMQPEMIPVNRSELRQNQSKLFKRAKGKRVLLVKSQNNEDEKYVLDKEYFEQLLKKYESLIETLEIAMDRRLFNQILAAADSLEEDLRLGKLHSFEEAFGDA